MKNWFFKYALITTILGIGIVQASNDGYTNDDSYNGRSNDKQSSDYNDPESSAQKRDRDEGFGTDYDNNSKRTRTEEEAPAEETFDCSKLTKISKCNHNNSCRWTKDKIKEGQYCDCWFSSMKRDEDFSSYSERQKEAKANRRACRII